MVFSETVKFRMYVYTPELILVQNSFFFFGGGGGGGGRCFRGSLILERILRFKIGWTWE